MMSTENPQTSSSRGDSRPCREINDVSVNKIFGRSANVLLVTLTFCLRDAELTLANDSRLRNIGLRCAGVPCDCVVWRRSVIQSEAEYQQVASR